MKKITFLIINFLLASMTTFAKGSKEILYVGTYSEKGEGIYVYEFDRKNLTVKELQILPNNPGQLNRLVWGFHLR